MNNVFVWAVFAGVLASGCQPGAQTESATPQSEPTNAAAPAAGPTGQATSEVTPGMSMADVKRIKGAPKDTRHDHGPDNAELDFWVYEDQTVKFQDGKVVE